MVPEVVAIARRHKYLSLLVLYACVYAYSIVFSVAIAPQRHGVLNVINRLHETCMVRCPVYMPNCGGLTMGRGQNYFIDTTTPLRMERLSNCLMTWWSVMHVAFHALLGWLTPDAFWLILAIGIGFELYEWLRFDCHDMLDPIWNLIGLLIGRCLYTRTAIDW